MPSASAALTDFKSLLFAIFRTASKNHWGGDFNTNRGAFKLLRFRYYASVCRKPHVEQFLANRNVRKQVLCFFRAERAFSFGQRHERNKLVAQMFVHALVRSVEFQKLLCSLFPNPLGGLSPFAQRAETCIAMLVIRPEEDVRALPLRVDTFNLDFRSEEHTSELQSQF